MDRSQDLQLIQENHDKQTYIQFCQVEERSLRQFNAFTKHIDEVLSHLKRECPTVTWELYYLTGGPADLVSILKSDQTRQLERAFRVVRDMDGLSTQYWVVTSWREAEEFLPMSHR